MVSSTVLSDSQRVIDILTCRPTSSTVEQAKWIATTTTSTNALASLPPCSSNARARQISAVPARSAAGSVRAGERQEDGVHDLDDGGVRHRRLGHDQVVADQVHRQGLGVLLTRGQAGKLTDRIGARPVVLAGLALTLAAAYRGLRPAQVPHASSATRILQQVGGSFGAAVFAMILQTRLPAPAAHGITGQTAAFDNAFWWSAGLTAASVAAALLLPATRTRSAPPHDNDRTEDTPRSPHTGHGAHRSRTPPPGQTERHA
jgi:hypothetical protein